LRRKKMGEKNTTIIGGGPGGYVAAIRAAQLGGKVTLIERDTLGGTCLNRGCMPTKALLQSADLLSEINDAQTFGISVQGTAIDFPAANRRKDMVVSQLVRGVESLMKKNKARVIKSTGTIIDPKTVGIAGSDETIATDSIIIATGSKPTKIPIEGIEGQGILTSDDALKMEQLPESILIIGGGVIGLEFGQIFHRMGSKVTIVEMMSQLLPTEDTEVAQALESLLKKEGIDIFTNATVKKISDAEGGKKVSFTTKDGDMEKAAEKVLIAVGRQPDLGDLDLSKLDIATDRGAIVVNERMETNIPGIYAIGDVVGGIMLAHVAMSEGKCAVQNALGSESRIDNQAIPRCIYTSPEVAAVGLTEQQAKESYNKVQVGRFPFVGNGRALTLNQTAGMVKVITEADYGQILGVHILGPNATELIAEAVLAIHMEATFRDLGQTMHAHPTLSEAVMEAALGVEGCAIHI
jgi:dihydrolipoamide dehydrogenase